MIDKKSPEEEIEELKIQLSKYRKENRILKERCESYEDRIEHFAIEREKLSRDIMRFESLELEAKQYDIEELSFVTQKLNHRIDILRKYLKTEREDNDKLNEFEELGFFERVRGKKPKSYDDIDI